MHRRLNYAGAIPRTLDHADPQTDILVGLSNLAQDILLSNTDPRSNTAITLVAGFKPSFPGGMSVSIEAGRAYVFAAVDVTAFGDKAPDSRVIMHQGQGEAKALNFAAAPATVGESRIDLVQVRLQTVDDTLQVLDYSSGVVGQPLKGPGGSNTAQATRRAELADVSIKQGAAGVTPVAPTPDAGYAAMFRVTIPSGKVSLVAGDLTVDPTAAFIAGLTEKHHTGEPGAAPKIDLTTEVQNVLPLANIHAGVIRSTEKGAANGVAPLDANGQVPVAHIPAVALERIQVVADQAAMLALTSTQVQPGDSVKQTNGGKVYVLSGTDPSVLGNWVEVTGNVDAATLGLDTRLRDNVTGHNDLRVTGGVERVTLVGDRDPLTGVYVPRDKRVTLSGPWQGHRQTEHNRGVPRDNPFVSSSAVPVEIYCDSANATATIKWRGVGLILIGHRYMNNGTYTVSTDGGAAVAHDMYLNNAAASVGNPIVIASGLAYGDHETVITVTGNKGGAGASSGADIQIAGFDILTTTDATLRNAAGVAFPLGSKTTLTAGSLNVGAIGTAMGRKDLVILRKGATAPEVIAGVATTSADTLATFQANNAIAYRVEAEDQTGKLANVWGTTFNVDTSYGNGIRELGTHGTTSNDTSGTDYVCFLVRGTGADLMMRFTSSAGIMAVSVNDGAETNYDLYSPIDIPSRRVNVASNLPFGDHKIKVRKTGTKNASATGTFVQIDAIEVYHPKAPALPADAMPLAEVLPTPSAGWVRFDDAAGWVYSGANWSSLTVAANTGGTVRNNGNTNATDTATFTFIGTQCRILANTSNGAGRFNVSIDGGANTLVDLYAASGVTPAVVYTSAALTPGSHTVTITMTNTKNASSSALNVALDSIEVLPLPVQVRDVRNVNAADTAPIDERITDHRLNERHPANKNRASLTDGESAATSAVAISNVTLTTKGGPIKAQYLGSIKNNTANTTAYGYVAIGTQAGINIPVGTPTANIPAAQHAHHVFDLPAGKYTVEFRGYVSGGTGTYTGTLIAEEV